MNTKHKRAVISRPFVEKHIVRRLRSRMLSMMFCNNVVEVVEDVDVVVVGVEVEEDFLLRDALDASDTDTRDILDISSSALIIFRCRPT